MKIKMSPNSLFAILLRSPWWVSMAVALAIVALTRALLPDPYWPAAAMGAIPFFVIAAKAAWSQARAPSQANMTKTLDAVVAMPWREFSLVMEDAFRREDYLVKRLTGSQADYALSKPGLTKVVSCKRWKAASHGIEPLRELQALRESLGAQDAMYVALGTVSVQAGSYARDNNIELVQGPALAQLLQDLAGG